MATRSSSRPYSLPFGELMSRTFAIYVRNFVPFFLLGLAVFSPWILLVMLTPQMELRTAQLLLGVGALVNAVLSMVLTGAITFGVVQQMRGKPAGVGACVAQGASSFFTVFGTALLSGLRVLIGFILLIIPGIIEICRLWVAIPAAVMERTGPSRSVDRSITLTDGSRWVVFGTIFFLGVVNGVINYVLDMSGIVGTNVYFYLALLQVVVVMVQIASATASAVAYFMLRKGKENIDVKELAAVFD